MASSTTPILNAGDVVKIDFLTARPDLNGRNAKLVEFLDEHGRWHAYVRDTHEHVRIKAANCFPSDGDPMEEDDSRSCKSKRGRGGGGMFELPEQIYRKDGQVLWCRVPDVCFKSPFIMQTTGKDLDLEAKKTMYQKTIDMAEEEKKPGEVHVYLKVTDAQFKKLGRHNFVTAGYFVLTKEMRRLISTAAVSQHDKAGGVQLVRDMSSSRDLSFEFAGESGPTTKMFGKHSTGLNAVNMVPHFSDNKKFKTPCAVWYTYPTAERWILDEANC